MIGIYKITNNINNKIYIGQSVNIERRWKDHLSNSSKKSLIHRAIEKYGKDNFTFEIIEECSIEELDNREIYWISYYDTFNYGYNLTRGGKSGFKYNIDAIYEDYLITNNMSKTSKNIGCHLNTVRNILHIFGINESNQQSDKSVQCIDPVTLEIIKQYDSIQEAADAIGISRSSISQAASGKVKSAGKYYWKFIDDNNKIFIPSEIKRYKEPVEQLDYYTGEILAEYESAKEAARQLGDTTSSGGSRISQVCNGKLQSAFGYKWKRKNDNNYIFIPPKTQLKKYNQKVQQIDLITGLVLNEFKSYAEAARSIGKSSKAADKISLVCRGKKESVYGYKWKNIDLNDGQGVEDDSYDEFENEDAEED